jgi:hypothetical protein
VVIEETKEELKTLLNELRTKKKKEDARHKKAVEKLQQQRDVAVTKLKMITNDYSLFYSL